MRDVHFQYVRDQYAMFELKGTKQLELQITQCKHPKDGIDVIMPMFNNPKYIKCYQIWKKLEGAHLQCVNNHYAMFEYIGMKTLGSYNYTNQTSLITVQHPSMKKYCSNVHKVGGAHLQCMNSHYTKLEYKGIKTLRDNKLHKNRHSKSVGD